MLDQYFTRLYIINLASRADRRAEMTAELAKLGLSLDDGTVKLFSAVKPEDKGAFPSIGARGCFLSHLGVLRDAAEKGEGPIAILEDDLAFADDFSARAPQLLGQLNDKNWSVFYGGYEGANFAVSGLNEVSAKSPLQTTHFICFNKNAIVAAQSYLEAMLARPSGDPAGGPMHVDGAYSWFRKDNPALQAFAASPPLGHQRSSRSDIAPLQWFDRTPVVRSIVSGIRKHFR